MKNLLVFDASTEDIVLGGVNEGKRFLHIQKFEKSHMSRELPEFFKKVSGEIDFQTTPEVMIGNGPGPFTGLKTGTSFFLGYLYSQGIKKIQQISSFKIYSALSGIGDRMKMVIIPFNKGECFLALADERNNLLLKDVFIKDPYSGVADLLRVYEKSSVSLICAGRFEEERIFEKIKGCFDEISVFKKDYSFQQEMFFEMNDLKQLDITKEPFILNHILHPAGIDSSCNIYISDIKGGADETGKSLN